MTVLDDHELSARWRRLAEARSNPFLTPEWFESWVESNPAEEPLPIVWRREGRVRGVLPLVRSRRGPWRDPALRRGRGGRLVRARLRG